MVKNKDEYQINNYQEIKGMLNVCTCDGSESPQD